MNRAGKEMRVPLFLMVGLLALGLAVLSFDLSGQNSAGAAFEVGASDSSCMEHGCPCENDFDCRWPAVCNYDTFTCVQ